jgi:hypothetical protein
LCRERLIPNPKDVCPCCKEMKEAGTPRSGREFLDMHHEMIRVFKYLLLKDGSSEEIVGGFRLRQLTK